MAGRLNPHFMLLEKHCELLREANRILSREAHRPHVARSAEATIAAIEPVALELIDEEYARIPRVQEMIYSSGSILLARKTSETAGITPVLSERTWRIALVNSGPRHVEDLLDGPVQVAGVALPLLERVREGDAFYGPLLTCVAGLDREVRLTDASTDWVFDCTPRPSETADFLRRQVEAFPEKYEDAAVEIARNGNWARLAFLFLAGAQMPTADASLHPEAEAFLSLVDSNHGRIEALSLLGSLEEALETSRPTIRLLNKLHAPMTAPQGA